jgi:hypothetical protein
LPIRKSSSQWEARARGQKSNETLLTNSNYGKICPYESGKHIKPTSFRINKEKFCYFIGKFVENLKKVKLKLAATLIQDWI